MTGAEGQPLFGLRWCRWQKEYPRSTALLMQAPILQDSFGPLFWLLRHLSLPSLQLGLCHKHLGFNYVTTGLRARDVAPLEPPRSTLLMVCARLLFTWKTYAGVCKAPPFNGGN